MCRNIAGSGLRWVWNPTGVDRGLWFVVCEVGDGARLTVRIHQAGSWQEGGGSAVGAEPMISEGAFYFCGSVVVID